MARDDEKIVGMSCENCKKLVPCRVVKIKNQPKGVHIFICTLCNRRWTVNVGSGE